MSEFAGENRRTLKKKNKDINISNQKVSTRDKNQPQKAGITEIKSNKNNNLLKDEQIKELEEEIDIFEKTKKLEKELEKKKLEMENQNQLDIEKIKSLNEDLSAYAKKKQELSSKNNKILTEMKQIAQDLSKKFTDSKLLKIMKKQNLKKNFNFEVFLREKQKNTKIKFIDINNKEIENLKKLLKKTDIENEEKLKEDLDNLNNEITSKQNELEELKKIKKEHELCEKMISRLNTQLNLLKNDIDLYTKIGNKNESEQVEKKEPIKLKATNKTMEYGDKVRYKSLKIERNKYSSIEMINQYKLYNNIANSYDKNQNTLKQTINIADIEAENNNNHLKSVADYSYSLHSFQLFMKNKDSKIKITSPKNYLFTEKEKKIMNRMIPERLMTDINIRYNDIDNQIKNVEEEKEKEHQGLKLKISNNDVKIKHLKLQIKEETFKRIEKNKKFVENKKKIKELENEIKKINENIIKEEKDYKRKIRSLKAYEEAIEKMKINDQKLKEMKEEEKEKVEKEKEGEEGGEEEGEEGDDEFGEVSDN